MVKYLIFFLFVAMSISGATLTWTAPGDDGNEGTALVYDVRYSQDSITDDNWSEATQLIGEPTPSIAGSTETYEVSGIGYYAIKAADEVPNWSGISNVVYIDNTCDIAEFILSTKCLLGK